MLRLYIYIYIYIEREREREREDCTVKFHLSGLIGTASHPDMQKIW